MQTQVGVARGTYWHGGCDHLGFFFGGGKWEPGSDCKYKRKPLQTKLVSWFHNETAFWRAKNQCMLDLNRLDTVDGKIFFKRFGSLWARFAYHVIN